jgi:hypothetical protein
MLQQRHMNWVPRFGIMFWHTGSDRALVLHLLSLCCTYLGALCHIVSLIPFKHVAQFELPIWIGATPAYKYREGISKDIPQE